jgi:hypothetical protein
LRAVPVILSFEDFSATCGLQRGALKAKILVVGRDAGIAEQHALFCA